jgi:hypothetical protein
MGCTKILKSNRFWGFEILHCSLRTIDVRFCRFFCIPQYKVVEILHGGGSQQHCWHLDLFSDLSEFVNWLIFKFSKTKLHVARSTLVVSSTACSYVCFTTSSNTLTNRYVRYIHWHIWRRIVYVKFGNISRNANIHAKHMTWT